MVDGAVLAQLQWCPWLAAAGTILETQVKGDMLHGMPAPPPAFHSRGYNASQGASRHDTNTRVQFGCVAHYHPPWHSTNLLPIAAHTTTSTHLVQPPVAGHPLRLIQHVPADHSIQIGRAPWPDRLLECRQHWQQCILDVGGGCVVISHHVYCAGAICHAVPAPYG